MINSKVLPLSLFICLFSVGLALGQQSMPTGKWWQMPRVINTLGLSQDQVDQLDDAYRENRRKLIRLKGDVEEAQFELQDLIEDRRLDEQAALEQYRHLEKAKTKLGVQRFKYFLEIRKIVGYERFQRLMEFRRQRNQQRAGNYRQNRLQDD